MSLLAQAKDLEQEKPKAARWEPKETDITWGQHFRSLDDARRHEYLAACRPVVSRDADGELVTKMDAFLWEHSGNKGIVSRQTERTRG
jgi:hypothetical protein